MEAEYHLFIVDDEPYVVDSLKILFETQCKLPIKVYFSYTAQDALKLFINTKIDIAILDIQMPEISGIELAQKLRVENPVVRIIFLTGYDQFDYAYEAIKQDAEDYILKTESDEKIIQAVQTSITQLENQRLMDERYKDVQNRYQSILPIYRKQLFINLLSGIIDSRDDLNMMMRGLSESSEWEFDADLPVYIVLARETQKDEQAETLDFVQKATILLMVENTLKEYLNEKQKWIESVTCNHDYVWLIAFTHEGTYAKLLLNLLLDAQKFISEKCATSLSFVISASTVPLYMVNGKYNDLKSMFIRNVLKEEEGIAIEGTGEALPNLDAIKLQQLNEFRSKIKICELFLEEGLFEKFRLSVHEMCSFINFTQQKHSFYALEMYLSIASMMLSYLNKNNLLTLVASKIELLPLFTMDQTLDWPQKAEYLVKLCDVLCNTCSEIGNYNVRSVVLQIKEYLISNLDSELNVAKLAEMTGFSATYLSRIFKRYENISLHDYITACRMDLARVLLSNTSLKVYEIARKCGYDNTAYFIKVFKTNTGYTPQEFKQMNAV